MANLHALEQFCKHVRKEIILQSVLNLSSVADIGFKHYYGIVQVIPHTGERM